jgi:putative flippase GtrA
MADRLQNQSAGEPSAADGKPLKRTGLRFLLTGIIVNGALFGVFALLLRFDVDYRVAATLTYVLGMIWGYLQNRIWSWGSTAPIFSSATRYLIVYLTIYLLHLGFIAILVEGLTIPALVAAIISTAGLIVPIFVVLDRFVFAGDAYAAR